MVGQNYLTQSLLYYKLLAISPNVLNAELKVKNRMIISILVTGPLDFTGANAHPDKYHSACC